MSLDRLSDKPSKPLSLLSILSILYTSQPRFAARKLCKLGSTSPLRVPITTPSSGVRPIEVSTLWPFHTAQVELPLPRCAVNQPPCLKLPASSEPRSET